MHIKNHKRIFVNFIRYNIKYSRQMFARHSRVGARTFHRKATPSLRKNLNSLALTRFVQLHWQSAIEQGTQKSRIFFYNSQHFFLLGFRKKRYANRDFVRSRHRALYLRGYRICRNFNVFDRAFIRIGFATRQAVRIVNFRQGV